MMLSDTSISKNVILEDDDHKMTGMNTIAVKIKRAFCQMKRVPIVNNHYNLLKGLHYRLAIKVPSFPNNMACFAYLPQSVSFLGLLGNPVVFTAETIGINDGVRYMDVFVIGKDVLLHEDTELAIFFQKLT